MSLAIIQKIEVTATELVISWPEEKVRAYVDSVKEQYTGLIIEQSDIKGVKEELAGLNKIVQALDTARKDIVKKLSLPISEVERSLKSMAEEVKEVRAGMDIQVKSFEEKERQGRVHAIQFMIDKTLNDSELKDFAIEIKPSWLNATAVMKIVQAEIENIVLKEKDDRNKVVLLERAKSDRLSLIEKTILTYTERYNISIPTSQFYGKFSNLEVDASGIDAEIEAVCIDASKKCDAGIEIQNARIESRKVAEAKRLEELSEHHKEIERAEAEAAEYISAPSGLPDDCISFDEAVTGAVEERTSMMISFNTCHFDDIMDYLNDCFFDIEIIAEIDNG